MVHPSRKGAAATVGLIQQQGAVQAAQPRRGCRFWRRSSGCDPERRARRSANYFPVTTHQRSDMMFRRLNSNSDAILAVNESFNFSDGTTSDIAQQLYIRHQKGDTVERMNVTRVPDDVVWRLSSHNLMFEDLPGMIQRAVLWDTGYALSLSNEPIRIYTLDGRSMATLMMTLDEFLDAGCVMVNCTQPNDEMAYTAKICNGTKILASGKCMATAIEDRTPVYSALWAMGGSISTVPEIYTRYHRFINENVTYIAVSVHTAPLNSEPAYDKCPKSGEYGSVTIPCFSKDDLSINLWTRMSVPVASEWVDTWLSQMTPSGSNKLPWIPIGLGSVVVFLAVVWIYWSRNRRQTRDYEQWIASRLWNDDEIIAVRIPREKVILQDLLSRGGFGEVYVGTFNKQRVAVKVLLSDARRDIRQVESFLAEAKMMAELDHPNIVRLVGVAWDSLADLCIVLEFIENGDLRTLLQTFHDSDHERGFDLDKLRIAQHVAQGLIYLHSLATPVLHRDLKSRNILLTAELDAKLTDFGVARESSEMTMTAGIGTSLWMAPEVMMGDKYDEKADMFSFGVVLSELDSHALPYAAAKYDDTGQVLSDTVVLQLVAMGELQVQFSQQCPREMVDLGMACVAIDPKMRPSAIEALYRLQLVSKSYTHLLV